ncbi:hypothetical protein ACIBF6_29150 [Streptosporangium amethystogenes]
MNPNGRFADRGASVGVPTRNSGRVRLGPAEVEQDGDTLGPSQ